MDITQGLPAILSTGTVQAVVSDLISQYAFVLALIPGLRPTDPTRTAFMRTIVYALNVAGLLALAWSQQIVISRSLVPALLWAAGGTVYSTLGYLATKKDITQGIEQASATIPAVPPIRGTGG